MKNLKTWHWILIGVLLILLVVAIVWYLGYRKLWKEIKVLVSKESAKYDQPADVERILLTACKEIVSDPGMYKMAKQYSESSGLPLPQVIVDNAVGLAKQYKYIQ